MYKKIGIGILVGIIFPIITVAIIYLISNSMNRVMNENIQSSGLLLGLGVNALATWFLFKKNQEYIGRGIMLATFVYFIIWVLKYAL